MHITLWSEKNFRCSFFSLLEISEKIIYKLQFYLLILTNFQYTLTNHSFLMILLGLPMVKFSEGMERIIKHEKFVMKTGSTVVTKMQLPLKLARAISIHKSQVKNTI